MPIYERRKTRQIHIGAIPIGGGAPISVQSMCNTKTTDTEATVQQIRELAAAGCDIVRLAVPDMEAAKNLGNIIRQVKTPLVADIHFDYKLALEAMAQGISAREGGIPIRIGVNAGSLDHKILTKYGGITAEALVASAMEHVRVLEELDFYDMKISLKAHDVPLTLAAYRLMSERVDYPLHLGITEAGTAGTGIIKSSVGVGALLAEGIGDTIRISLTGDPVVEVRTANEILKALGLKEYGPTLVACPTCGRTSINLVEIAEKVEERLRSMEEPIEVAVMGCVVIAGGNGEGLIFRKGEVVRKVKEEDLLSELFREIDAILEERKTS